ncbi:hypothetical protein UFOVP1290_16 [uncultured Caudovirales phage]|uniref:Uncharacterized protein n=1 Tax=uncultured Caudovirales phage TaxID=2100421 RepID=A0A6J5RQE7_9CAUD|nr:hypothetical protein UFOVP1290_16 [uncultured Caudovirales phage]
MDPVQKIWMYENWLADQNDDAELAKNHAYLLASFWNPEAVKQILGGGNVHESSDDEFEETTKMVKDASLKSLEEKTKTKRRRRRHNIKE